MSNIITYIPHNLKKIKWELNKKGINFPKINNYKTPSFNRGNIYGCKLYYQLAYNLYTDIKLKYNNCKWVCKEYPFYYKSLYNHKKDGDYKLTVGFMDFLVVYNNFIISIEVDELKPHSMNNPSYFNNDYSKWIKKQFADKGKDKELYNEGIICMHVSEEASYKDVLNQLEFIFKQLDKYAKNCD